MIYQWFDMSPEVSIISDKRTHRIVAVIVSCDEDIYMANADIEVSTVVHGTWERYTVTNIITMAPQCDLD